MKTKQELLAYTDRPIYQDDSMFQFTLDSVLVARFMKLNSKIKKIADFGTNNAVIPLILTKYTHARIVGVEIEAKAVEIARENLEMNHLTNQVSIVHQDIKAFAQEHPNEFDAVICNPPYFKTEGNPKRRQTSEHVANARHESLITLEEIIACGSRCINNAGTFTIVHRAERTAEILNFFEKYHITAKRMRFVHSKQNREAKTVLLEGAKTRNAGIQILPPLIAHNSDETYTEELLTYFRD